MEGDNAGEVLPGQAPIDAAVRELQAILARQAPAMTTAGKRRPSAQ
jgi:hypothetical protein